MDRLGGLSILRAACLVELDESIWQSVVRAAAETQDGRTGMRATMIEKLVDIPTLDSLMADPGKVVELTPEAAQMLLIGLASLQPLLIQRALMGPQNGQEDLLLTIPQVAERLKVSEYRAYELVRQGVLKSVRLGKKSVRVKPAALAEYVAGQGT